MAGTPPPPGLEDFVNASAPGPASDGPVGTPPGLDDFIAPEMRTAKYGTLPQQALKVGEDAASAMSFGTSRGLERLASDKFNIPNLSAEAQKGRDEEDPGSGFIGSAIGLGASTLLGGYGAANLLEHAGAGAAGALGLGAEGAGLGSRLAASGVKSAVEGALFQGGSEVGKMLLADPATANPGQMVETAAANIGLAGLIGGGIGATLGGGHELWNATIGNKVGTALGAAGDAIDGAHTELPADYFQDPMARESIGVPRDNAQEVMEAASRIPGANPTTAMLFGDETTQRWESNLAQSTTVPGQMMNREYNAFHEALSDASEGTLKYATAKSSATVGKELEAGLSEKLAEEYKPIKAAYDELEPHLKAMPVSDDVKLEAIDPLVNHEFATVSSASKAQAKTLADEIEGVQNVYQIKTLRTIVNARLRQAYSGGSGGGEMGPLLQAAKDALTKMRSSAIEEATAGTGVGKGAKGISDGIISDLRDADAKYAAYKAKAKQLGVEASLGNVGDARSMEAQLAKRSSELMAGKIFNTKDVASRAFFKENFPEQYELARRSQLAEIKDASYDHSQGSNGRFVVSKYLKQVRDLEPEARAELFPGEGQRIADVQKLHEAFPRNFNPSGSGAYIADSKIFSIEGLLHNASDAVKYAFLKSLPHLREAASSVGGGEAGELSALNFARNDNKSPNPTAFKSMATFIGQTIRGESLLGKATSAIFDAGKEVLPSKLIPDDKTRDKLDDKLKHLQANAAPLMQDSGNLGEYMPDHQQAVAQTTGRAVQYINSLRPNLDKKSPLDAQPVASKTQTAEFNRALDIAQQPLITVQAIKDGSLNSKDMIHLRSMYPDLYTRLSTKISTEMANAITKKEAIPYKTRMGLSLFLGQPLDSTMTPQGIMAAQGSISNSPPAGPQGPAPARGGGPHSMKNIGKLAESMATPGQAREMSRGSKA